MTLYLHIGLRKTGTTSLQKILHQNAEIIRAHGINYVSRVAGLPVEEENAHHFLAHGLLNKRHRYTPKVDFSELDAHASALRDEICSVEGVNVISSEDFSRLEDYSVFKLAEYFSGVDVKILIYLRRQDAWIDSLYGQMLKVGRDLSIDQLIDFEERSIDIPKFLLPWENAFGSENIIIRIYEGEAKNNIWEDFCSAVGVDSAKGCVEKMPIANKSLSYQSTKFLNLLGDAEANKSLRPIFENMEMEMPNSQELKFLDNEKAISIMARYEISNNKIANKYLGREKLFLEDAPLPVRGNANITIEEFAQTAGLIMARLANRVVMLEKKVHGLRKRKG